MEDDFPIPPSAPRDFLLRFIQKTNFPELSDILLDADGPLNLFAVVVTGVAFVAAIVLWARRITFSRAAVLTYLTPAVLAGVDFVARLHSVGNRLGSWHLYASELVPHFAEHFVRLYVGIVLSVLLFSIAACLHALYRRISGHARQANPLS